ncbi:MAG: hypothetical protein IPL04_09890 [Chitinophagaceae bacterium]|nr:hypothetical protein [Chitinophagaceae bacterium]
MTEGENAILKRFAKVFEQSYTRFLDLQKAEAQAREAEIELALERVRARTMAMQHSEELLEVATVLFQQVKGLGVPQWNCGFNIWEPGDKAFTYYPGSPDGVISPSPCKIPLNDHPVFRRFDESRKKGIELLVYEKEGEEQKIITNICFRCQESAICCKACWTQVLNCPLFKLTTLQILPMVT